MSTRIRFASTAPAPTPTPAPHRAAPVPETATESLFPDLVPGPAESADARRTRRQAEAIAAGYHPLALVQRGLRLHPDASRDPDDRGDETPRCGDCVFRVLGRWHGRVYGKCAFGLPDGAPLDAAPRASHSAATDVRAWWPACTDYQPEEPTP